MPSTTPPEGSSPGPDTTAARPTGEESAEVRVPDPIHETATIVGSEAALAPSDRPQTENATAVPVGLEEFRIALVDTEVIGADELEILAAGVPASEGVLGLARTLQKAGRLTAYQAAALYQRKSRGLLIGNYLILEKLGAGGMGVVFKARHRKLGRVVAVKILPPSFARDKTAVQRFQREVEAAGRLKHPNIVAALDASEDRGVHFLVMEYVQGRDLDGVIRHSGPLSVARAIDYLLQGARGLEAAHAEGIVHRDIKPSNLMLDAQGAVRVLDLGLARIVDASNPFGRAAGARLTESGMYMGTVDYMAPEQADDSRRADHRADIYALGCTLHYLLTGKEPFSGETILKRLMAHQERPAPLLRAARPEVPPALEDAFQKMMAKRPADRPPSMTAVIALLEVCRTAAAESPRSAQRLMVFDNAVTKPARPAGTVRDPVTPPAQGSPESLQVGPELSLEDLVMDVRPASTAPLPPAPAIKRAATSRRSQSAVPKPARRSPIRTAVAAVLTVALLGLVVTIAMNGRRRGAPPQPKAASGPVVAEPEKIAANDPRDHPPLSSPNVPTPTVSKPKASAGTTPEPKRVIGDRTQSLDGEHVYRATFAPDGKTYATGGDRATIRIFDTQDGKLVRSIKLNEWVQSLRFSSDGTRLFTVGVHTRVYTWDVQSGTELGRCDGPEFGSLEDVVFAPDCVLGICAHPDGNLRLWDLAARKRLHRLPRTRGAGYCFTPDSQDVVIQNYSKPLGRYTVERIAARDDVPRWSVHVSGIDAPVNGCWCVPATGDLVTVYDDGTVLVLDVADGKERRRLSLGMAIRERCSCLAPDGRALLTGHDDNTVRLWSLPEGRLRRQFTLDTIPTGPPAISPDGRSAVAHSFRGQQYFWRLPELGPASRDGSLAAAQTPAQPAAGPSLLENARTFLRLDQPDRAIPLYEKALKAHPEDARAWVEYGRMLAAHGRDTDVDAAFLHAAKLAPGDFESYLSHWWIIGPFAFDIRAMEAPQNRPDPSHPIPAPTPRHWRLVQADPDGMVDLAELFSPSERISAYALTYLYTREERELAISLSADDFVRVWLNGKLVFEHIRGPAIPATTIPHLVLLPGRNTLLIKVANDRIGFGFGIAPLSSRLRGEKPARAL